MPQVLLELSKTATCTQGEDAQQTPKRVKLTQFTVGSVLMNELMPAIMKLVHETPVLKEKLYQVNFHTTLSGEAMVTLVYHKKLSEDWRKAAEHLRESLSSVPSSTHGIVQVSQDMNDPVYCHHAKLMLAYLGRDKQSVL